ncbi:MAG: hypothetical protein HY762_02420 [Planctomycetes bacterium]|nr:hypothetical protein [Planctomycetota bacterium]
MHPGNSAYLSEIRQAVGFPFDFIRAAEKNMVSVATMTLANMPALRKQYLKPDDKITGRPVRICLSDKTSDFKKALNNQIMKSGSAILQARSHLKWW